MKEKVGTSSRKLLSCDETWVHYYKLESKGQSMEWKHAASPVRKQFKNQQDNASPHIAKLTHDTINKTSYPITLIIALI